MLMMGCADDQSTRGGSLKAVFPNCTMQAGIPVIVSAGNSYGADACTQSPAACPVAVAVGATTIQDQLASYSNVGSCVDIFAPGTGYIPTPCALSHPQGLSHVHMCLMFSAFRFQHFIGGLHQCYRRGPYVWHLHGLSSRHGHYGARLAGIPKSHCGPGCRCLEQGSCP